MAPAEQRIKYIELNCQCLNTIFRDKKDFMLLKLSGLQFCQRKDPNILKSLVQFKIQDCQLIQDDFELLMKHYSGLQNPDFASQTLWEKAIESFNNHDSNLKSSRSGDRYVPFEEPGCPDGTSVQ